MDHTKDVGSKEQCVAMLEAFKSTQRTSIHFRLWGTTHISISKTPAQQSYFFTVSKEGSHRAITGYCNSIDDAINRLDDYLDKSIG